MTNRWYISSKKYYISLWIKFSRGWWLLLLVMSRTPTSKEMGPYGSWHMGLAFWANTVVPSRGSTVFASVLFPVAVSLWLSLHYFIGSITLEHHCNSKNSLLNLTENFFFSSSYTRLMIWLDSNAVTKVVIIFVKWVCGHKLGNIVECYKPIFNIRIDLSE